MACKKVSLPSLQCRVNKIVTPWETIKILRLPLRSSHRAYLLESLPRDCSPRQCNLNSPVSESEFFCVSLIELWLACQGENEAEGLEGWKNCSKVL